MSFFKFYLLSARKICMIKNRSIFNSSKKILIGKSDFYDRISVKSCENKLNKKTALKVLQNSINEWNKDNIHSVWFEIKVEEIWWLPILLKHKFTIHHAQPNYIMMTKWFLEKPSFLPKYPFTFIGAGGFVVNSKEQILLIKESSGPYLGWKFPGGAADYNESIYETAIREVFEETGMETEFVTILAFRQVGKFLFENNSNIFFICLLKLKDEFNIKLKPCPNEIASCKWMSREEISALPENEFSWFGNEILQQYDNWLKSGKRGITYTKLPNSRKINQKLNVSENFNLKNSKSLSNQNEMINFYFIN